MTFFRKNRPSHGKSRRLSLNQMLSDAQIVLRKFKEKLGTSLGFSVFDDWQISSKYEKFYGEWVKMGRPKMYFATMDIQKCYDSIVTENLLKFLRETEYLDPFYLICRYGALFRNKNQIRKNNEFCKIKALFNFKERVNALKYSEISDYHKYFNEIYDENKIGILVDLMYRKNLQKEVIIEHLEYICKKHIILVIL